MKNLRLSRSGLTLDTHTGYNGTPEPFPYPVIARDRAGGAAR